MEIKMNIFQRKSVNIPDNGNGKNILEQFEISNDWEESYVPDEKKDTTVKKNYCPNAELFRRLIEGTSFDRRINKKIEPVEKPIKLKEPSNKHITAKQHPKADIKLSIRKTKNEINLSQPIKPLTKKKFINEKAQKRLEHITNNVFNL